MKIVLKLMRVGMSMQEATIVQWFKQPGDRFIEGDAIYAFETDKVTQEVSASGSGILIDILIPAGEDAAVGEPLCTINLDT